MGGTVAVVVRLESGEEYRMHRWTNALPWFYNNIKFFQKDMTHIEEYLNQWKEMRDDWHANHETGKFAFNMTGCYAPYPAPLAPASYGIVVFDFMKNAVVSAQDYTSFDKCYLVGKSDSERHEAQIELLERGRIKSIVAAKRDYDEIVDVPKNADEFRELISRERRQDNGIFCYNVIYDTSPFKIHEFDPYKEDFLRAKQVIVDLGFKLTSDDEAAWDKYFKEREE